MPRATVPSFAKLNLSLKVIGKRPDGYHELRTVFQSITLSDRLAIEFQPGRGSEVELDSSIDIPDNLVIRAARALMEAASIRGMVRCRLDKRIPMGAGLGGGSSNAAAVLLALPALARKPVPIGELSRIAATLGSDVPYFLYGGAALGLGRGEELFPLPDPGPRHALLVTPGIHVSTPAAFAGLAGPAFIELTPTALAHKMERFQSAAWGLACANSRVADWEAFCENDFEAAVFPKFPLLKSLYRKLSRSGGSLVRMTGSGSALFGLFPSREACERGLTAMRKSHLPSKVTVQTIRFSSRVQYRAAWRRSLRVHLTEAAAWPPK